MALAKQEAFKGEKLYEQVPAVLELYSSAAAGGVIWDLRAVDCPAWEPELLHGNSAGANQ